MAVQKHDDDVGGDSRRVGFDARQIRQTTTARQRLADRAGNQQDEQAKPDEIERARRAAGH